MSNNIANLRPLELKTMEALKASGANVMSREDWLNRVYQGQQEPSLKTLDVTINSLRKKLAGTGYVIRTVWGRGYELIGGDHAKPV